MAIDHKRKVPGIVLLIGGVILAAGVLAIVATVFTRTLPQNAAACGAGQFCIESNVSAAVPTATPFTYKFTIVSENGSVLKNFNLGHEKLMHMFIIRHDTKFFQHVHPEYDATTGEFSVALQLPQAGTYRIIADFIPGNAAVNVQALQDIVAGSPSSATAPALAPSASYVQDGFDVELSTDPKTVRASTDILLTFTIKKDGKSVQDIEPYLGELGHVVILRQGSLDFVHTHPISAALENGQVIFHASLLQAGNYKIFAQFEYRGKLVTAEFVVKVQP